MGVFGGRSAQPSKFVRNPDTDEETELGSKSTTRLDPGDVVSIRTPGGGGYGDPVERDPDAVLDDVLDEKVSAERATDAYSVVLSDDGETVDREATDAHREERRAEATADGGVSK